MQQDLVRKSRRNTAGRRNYVQPRDMDMETIARKQKRQEELAKEVRDSVFEHRNWNVREKIKWLLFMERYQDIADWSNEKKSNFLYKQMSLFMKNRRTPEQCKNIHSLLKRKFYGLKPMLIAVEREVILDKDFYRLSIKYQAQLVTFHGKNMSSAIDSEEEEMVETRKQNRAEKQAPAQPQVLPPQHAEPIITRQAKLVELANYHFLEWLKHTQAYQILQQPLPRKK